MSDNEGKAAAEQGVEGGGPGAVYQQYVIMEELLDKLKLLHYENTYCRQLGFKAISRHYFALPTNSGEQFFTFTSIAAWLLQMCGKQFEQPQEFDDPNATIASILDQVRLMGHKPDFAPSKLKTGSGEQCLWVLDRLADEALKAKAFAWKRPVYPEEEADDENVMDDNSELNLNKVEEDMLQSDDEIDEEENVLGLDDLQKRGARQDIGAGTRPEVILESKTDAAEWRLEVERVLPQLKVTIRTDNKDWRVHVDAMHSHQDSIQTSLTETTTQLDRLHDEISRTLEKIASREKYINNQLERHLQEFRAQQDRLAETKEKYRQASGGVTERTRSLAEISDELERIKAEMEERGTSMTDGAPLVKIKQAMARLKQESMQMNIRTGVLQHILLRAKLKEKHNSNKMAALAEDEDDNIAYRGY